MAVNFCRFSQTYKHWENNSNNTLVWNTTAQLWGVLFREARMRFPVFNKSLEFLGTKYSGRKRTADLPHNLFMWNTLNTKQYYGSDYTTTHAVNIKLWSALFSNDSMSAVSKQSPISPPVMRGLFATGRHRTKTMTHPCTYIMFIPPTPSLPCCLQWQTAQ